ncbi:MAG: GTPase Era [Candidatus Eremiobacteraeota bacterium]|nr:GTPase Era [Candidatus Eremiobacteraeota bacterium]
MKSNNADNDYRSGFIALTGLPNVGKSTLINMITGAKVSIVSDKPQTTRHRILGVKTGEGYQIVFVDTPGFYPPRHELGKYLVKVVKEETQAADLVLLLVDGAKPRPEKTIKLLKKIYFPLKNGIPIFLVINKIDLIPHEKILEIIENHRHIADFEEVIPVSAKTGENIDLLVDLIKKRLPEGPQYFPPDAISDQDQKIQFAEIIREKLLILTRQEIPHSVAVQVEEIRPGKSPGTLYINAVIFVEKPSQKGIILGKGGKLIKKAGMLAREEIEFLTGENVYIDLWVKVKDDWRERPDVLRQLGYW